MSDFVTSSVQRSPRPGSRGHLLWEPTSPHPYFTPPQTFLYRTASTSLAFLDAARESGRDRAREELRHSFSSAGRDDGDDAAPVA